MSFSAFSLVPRPCGSVEASDSLPKKQPLFDHHRLRTVRPQDHHRCEIETTSHYFSLFGAFPSRLCFCPKGSACTATSDCFTKLSVHPPHGVVFNLMVSEEPPRSKCRRIIDFMRLCFSLLVQAHSPTCQTLGPSVDQTLHFDLLDMLPKPFKE